MAIKARGQIGIYDVTDAYSPYLSTDAYTFQGDTTKVKSTQTFSTVVSALQGAKSVKAAVDTTAISLPTGLTVDSDEDTTSPTLTFTATTALTMAVLTAFGGIIDIPIVVNGEVTIHKSIAISIALTGAGGTAARSVLVGNEAQCIYCDKDGKASGEQTITIPFAGYNGASRVACTMADPTLPSGFTKVSNTAATTSADGSYVFKVASRTAIPVSGKLDLKITNSTTFNKVFTYTRAQTGATGSPGSNGTSATSVVCGNESVSIPCTLGGLVTANMEIVIPFAGYIGTARADCTVSYSTLPSGITLKSGGNKAATASADGSLTFSVAANGTLGNAATKNGEITLTFVCNSQSFVKKFSWAKAMTGATGSEGPQGPKGNDGDDAITVVVIPTGGTVFKNSSGSKTLTAHVFVGNAEVTGNALSQLGTIKWYKGAESTTSIGSGTTFVVNASDVNESETYEARLET